MGKVASFIDRGNFFTWELPISIMSHILYLSPKGKKRIPYYVNDQRIWMGSFQRKKWKLSATILKCFKLLIGKKQASCLQLCNYISQSSDSRRWEKKEKEIVRLWGDKYNIALLLMEMWINAPILECILDLYPQITKYYKLWISCTTTEHKGPVCLKINKFIVAVFVALKKQNL